MKIVIIPDIGHICQKQYFLKCGKRCLDGTHYDIKEYPDFNYYEIS